MGDIGLSTPLWWGQQVCFLSWIQQLANDWVGRIHQGVRPKAQQYCFNCEFLWLHCGVFVRLWTCKGDQPVNKARQSELKEAPDI